MAAWPAPAAPAPERVFCGGDFMVCTMVCDVFVIWRRRQAQLSNAVCPSHCCVRIYDCCGCGCGCLFLRACHLYIRLGTGVTRSGQSCSISNVTSSLRIMSCLQRATMNMDEQAQSAKLLNPVRATPTSFGSVVPLSSDEFLKCMLSGSGRTRSHG